MAGRACLLVRKAYEGGGLWRETRCNSAAPRADKPEGHESGASLQQMPLRCLCFGFVLRAQLHEAEGPLCSLNVHE